MSKETMLLSKVSLLVVKLHAPQFMELTDSVPILSLTWLYSEEELLRQPKKTTSLDSRREICPLELVRKVLLG